MSDSTAGPPLPARERRASRHAGFDRRMERRAERRAERRVERRGDSETFLDHYFRRIDKRVAASFTAEQRDAILTMFGGRGIGRHPVDVRASLPLGRRRYYLVFLLGPDRRQSLQASDVERRGLTELLGYGLLAAGILLPLFVLVLALRT